MNQLVVNGIVLSRLNYGEADRIITVLTKEQGKIRLLAKGVRKIKSKLAGGIELFSQNSITYIQGRGDMGTLISSRLITNYESIIKDLDRTMFAYEILKQINKITEDNADENYFTLTSITLGSINNLDMNLDSIKLWFNLNLLEFGGFSPNLETEPNGQKLQDKQSYIFSFDDMSFVQNPRGNFESRHIKLLRLVRQINDPKIISNINDAGEFIPPLVQLTSTMLKLHSNLQ